MTSRCDRLWRNARLATLAPSREGLGVIDQGLVAAEDGIIVFAGPESEAPSDFLRACDADNVIDCGGRLVTPGLIDCHTHLVYAGNRANEFEQRLKGANYEDIARAGGGIVATVRATRVASEEELIAQALPRLDALLNEGVTTVEIKSGYGLSHEHERKQLRAARALASHRRVAVLTTFLGAHAVPPEYGDRSSDYITEVCERMLPALAGERLIDAVDAFCERIGFSIAETERVFAVAHSLSLPVKLHAEQLSNLGGTALAARHHALSADHLEYVDELGIKALAKSGTAAVLLPGAFYFLRETQLPPVELLRKHGVPMALATDCNPGTSPITSPLAIMNMAATLFRLTVDECLLGFTREAAKALGQAHRLGTLEPGKQCDLAVWNVERPAELVYPLGARPLHLRVWNGS
jgi:imidazolonepropionase